MLIEDGKGTGKQAKVSGSHRLYVDAKSSSLQHIVSEEEEGAYQVIGTTTAASGTETLLHITNNDTTRELVLSYIRLQQLTLAGGTALPNAANYFSIRLGSTYVSGGAAVVPVNVNAGSSNAAAVTVYQTSPVLAGTALEIDRWYPVSDGETQTYSKEGALIINAGQTLEISYVGDHTSGVLYSRVSFYMEPED